MKYYSFTLGYIDRQEDPTVLELCRKLRNEALNPMLDYKHVYQAGDTVIWDQLKTNHRVINKKGDKRRICWRASFDDNLVREYYERN
jgi:alpha-ketoglutarate-dependent taurine dioxygenase